MCVLSQFESAHNRLVYLWLYAPQTKFGVLQCVCERNFEWLLSVSVCFGMVDDDFTTNAPERTKKARTETGKSSKFCHYFIVFILCTLKSIDEWTLCCLFFVGEKLHRVPHINILHSVRFDVCVNWMSENCRTVHLRNILIQLQLRLIWIESICSKSLEHYVKNRKSTSTRCTNHTHARTCKRKWISLPFCVILFAMCVCVIESIQLFSVIFNSSIFFIIRYYTWFYLENQLDLNHFDWIWADFLIDSIVDVYVSVIPYSIAWNRDLRVIVVQISNLSGVIFSCFFLFRISFSFQVCTFGDCYSKGPTRFF